MRRELYDELLSWKAHGCTKPLVLHGMRQVGKTWLLKEFGEKEFAEYAYILCDNNRIISDLFDADFDIPRIIKGLELYCNQQLDPKTSLIIFDEIQEIPKALTALKYFAEANPRYSIVAAGSNLGVSNNPGSSFPVGKVFSLTLRPMSFREFLLATGDERYVDLLEAQDHSSINPFHEHLLGLVKNYMMVGGMPDVVKIYAQSQDLLEARKVQKELLRNYQSDFAKYADKNTARLIGHIWDSIPSQLAKENRKFIWKQVRSGARAAQYEGALQWLSDAGLIHKLHWVEHPQIPLKGHADFKVFKIFLADVGLLGALSDTPPQILLHPTAQFIQHKGDLAEQFVLQELIAANCSYLTYWSNPKGKAELDFLATTENEIVPIEVKSGSHKQAKSLKVFLEKYAPDKALRFSTNEARLGNTIIDLPLYSVSQAFGYL